MNWAMEQATGDPRAQCLLYVIADLANEEGVAWPGADWMAEKSQQSRATVYRRLEALQAMGLLVTFPRWIDERGKVWNAAAPGRRRTSPEIRLQFGVFIKQQAPTVDDENPNEGPTPQSQPETGVSLPETGSSQLVRQGSSHCGDNNHHLNRKEDIPPNPPPGGVVDLEGWKDFETDWGEPILRQSLARQVWAALKPDERDPVRRAARGYAIYLRSQKRPPNRLGAHLFLKERDAWEGFAKLAPDAVAAEVGDAYDANSIEGRAIIALYAVARTRPRELRGRVLYPDEITPQLLAFADVDVNPRAVFLDDPAQISRWSQFIAKHVKGARTGLIDTRGIGADMRRGVWAPKPWPPRVDGKWSTENDEEDLNFQ